MDVQIVRDSLSRRPAGLPVRDSEDGLSQGARMRALLAAHTDGVRRRAVWWRRWECVRARWDAFWTVEEMPWAR